ncbi:MAG: tripartite tricarboxylate transporter permease [Chloroflexi bacterium]|nr:tripartite tricarboxylate transporter permease [Chloroflexota bacterium]
MFDAAIQGFMGLQSPYMWLLMLIGVAAATIVGILPGIGSTALLTMALPFAMTLSPYAAIALLVSMDAVSSTGSTITSVLTGIPGSSSSLATIVDGYPLAKKGEGARGCAAGITASALGGVFGAFVLFATLPVLRPLVLALGSPEYFMLALWGISMVAVLSGKTPFKGLCAGFLGILIMMVGMDPKSGVPRYVFNQPYLWDGIDLMLISMGIYAVPEVMAMAVSGSSIAKEFTFGTGLFQGIKDCFKHWFLIIRSSAIGTWIGFLPGVGGPTAAWMAYGHAIQTEKNRETFGKGDIRGVIAPESSNNGVEGGSYITTLAFGIPGSTSTALILIVFLAVGIQPGPSMLTEQLHLTFAVIWALVMSNLVGAVGCLALAKPIARMTFWPFHTVVPIIVVLVVLGAFTANFSINDFILVSIVSFLGFFMKRYKWPRAPLLLGVVLGPIMEKYLWLSYARYGLEWLWRPGVIILFLMVFGTVVLLPWYQEKRARKAQLTAKA